MTCIGSVLKEIKGNVVMERKEIIMKLLKMRTLYLSAVIACLILTAGCSKSTSENTAANSTDTNAAANDDTTLSGRVTAVDGDTITVSVFMGGNNFGGSGKEGGMNRGSGDDTNASGKSGTGTPEKGERPSNDGTGSDKDFSNAPQGEEKTITVTSDTKYTIEDGDTTTDGTLSDVTVGTMISIEFATDSDSKDVPTTITIRNFSQGDFGNRDGQGTEAPADGSKTK